MGHDLTVITPDSAKDITESVVAEVMVCGWWCVLFLINYYISYIA